MKSKNFFTALLVVILIINLCPCFLAGQPSLASPGDIVNHIQLYLGTQNSIIDSTSQPNISRIVLADTTLPGLFKEIGKKTYLKIEFPAIDIKPSKSPMPNRNSVTMAMTVFLDSNTSQLYKIRFSPIDKIGAEAKQMADDNKSDALWGAEKFHGFPVKAPVVGLIELLSKNFDHFESAEEIEAYFFTYSLLNLEPRDVWSIHLHRLPSSIARQSRPDSLETDNKFIYIRKIFDGKTGELLSTHSISPYPLIRVDKNGAE